MGKATARTQSAAEFGAAANMTIINSVVAGNVGAACGIVGGATATITSAGHNIDDDGTCQLTAAGDQPSTDPLLGPLADNGGPTLTHALGAGSLAIDAGACPATDQRGVARPQGRLRCRCCRAAVNNGWGSGPRGRSPTDGVTFPTFA